jgi:hypothetical protein
MGPREPLVECGGILAGLIEQFPGFWKGGPGVFLGYEKYFAF